MSIKKRFVLPLIYIALLGVSFIIPKLGEVLFVFCESIVGLIVLGITIALGGPKATHDLIGIDVNYIVIFGTIIQFFLLGYLWDVIAEKIRNRKYWDKPI